MNKKLLIFSFFLLILFAVYTPTIGAQTPDFSDIGLSISVSDTNVQNGDLICSGSEGYKLCTNEYDSSIYGVVNNNPSVGIQITDLENSHTVVSKGQTTVRVSSINGNIKVGDFLTSSKTPGVAELAVNNGYVIGTALQSYNSDDKNAVGNIQISLNIHPRTDSLQSTRENLLDILRNGLSGLSLSPIAALRYVLAALIVIVSFVIGFIYFGRIAITGIEAIGRNPLAIGRIQFSVILNILIMLGVVLGGLGVAYLILAL
jgi:hypothetical protein